VTLSGYPVHSRMGLMFRDTPVTCGCAAGRRRCPERSILRRRLVYAGAQECRNAGLTQSEDRNARDLLPGPFIKTIQPALT
jgi:hypothetical protein